MNKEISFTAPQVSTQPAAKSSIIQPCLLLFMLSDLNTNRIAFNPPDRPGLIGNAILIQREVYLQPLLFPLHALVPSSNVSTNAGVTDAMLLVYKLQAFHPLLK